MTTKLASIHPGEILREEFLLPLGLSAGTVARAVGVPRTRIERLAKEEDRLEPELVRIQPMRTAS